MSKAIVAIVTVTAPDVSGRSAAGRDARLLCNNRL
jgi:hypothetical protein